MIVNFSAKQVRYYQNFTINKTPVERVNSFKYLGVHIPQGVT